MLGGLNVLVAGGAQAGKTTMLNALCAAIPARKWVVTVEEVFELQVSLPDIVAMQTRLANLGGNGEIPMRRLVVEALRMRPSRLVVGEVRQAQCLELLLAMNSGLPAMCTLHANCAREGNRAIGRAVPPLGTRRAGVDHTAGATPRKLSDLCPRLLAMATTRQLWDLDAERTDLVVGLFVEELLILTMNAEVCVRHLRETWHLLTGHDLAPFDEFFLAVQGILSSAASISKVFWPVGHKDPRDNKGRRRLERGAHLRLELGVPDDSPLKVRRVRNDFEHMDERLDVLGLAMAHAEAADRPVLMSRSWLGYDGVIDNEDNVSIVFSRVYIEDRDAIRMFDNEMIIHEYLHAIREVQENCVAWKVEREPEADPAVA